MSLSLLPFGPSQNHAQKSRASEVVGFGGAQFIGRWGSVRVRLRLSIVSLRFFHQPTTPQKGSKLQALGQKQPCASITTIPPNPPKQEPSRPPTGWQRGVRSWPGSGSARLWAGLRGLTGGVGMVRALRAYWVCWLRGVWS